MILHVRQILAASTLASAAMLGDLETMNFLISKGADVNGINSYGDTPLHYALQYGKLEAAKLLVEHNADVNKPNDFGISPFIAACNSGHLELAKLFFTIGAHVDNSYPINVTPSKRQYNDPLILYASGWGHIEVVEFLIEKGVDLEYRNSYGKSALDYAKEKNYPDIVALIENALKQGNNNPMHLISE